MTKFFFINTYDQQTANIIYTILKRTSKTSIKLEDRGNILCNTEDIALDDYINENKQHYDGCIINYGFYRLYDDSLRQKSKTTFRKINILVNPVTRTKLLYNSIIKNINIKNSDDLLSRISLRTKDASNPSIKIYLLHYFIRETMHNAKKLGLCTNNPEDLAFIYALVLTISTDYTDTPVPGKHIKFESLLSGEISIKEFIQHVRPGHELTNIDKCNINEYSLELSEYKKITGQPLTPTHQSLFNAMMNQKLESIYYPHINKSLSQLHLENGYFPRKSPIEQEGFVLISIQLNSNRPAQLIDYLNNIEETAINPEQIEVIININDDDLVMSSLLREEIKNRKFILKFITTPRPESFCDLWKPINSIYKHTSQNAYFLLNVSDEMLFAEKGWDEKLKKYIDYFPDGLFRLRASRNKLRAYFDRWECSFAQDSIPITTKKWVDIGGNWNPCFGPDSFQQLISYYLSKESKFSNQNYLRDVPVFDIKFLGDIPSLGMEEHKRWKHIKDHIDAMLICQSQPMLQEAKRRALLIEANILTHNLEKDKITIVDDTKKKKIYVLQKDTKKPLHINSYRISKIIVFLENNIRKLNYFNYFGDGKPSISHKTALNYIKYLSFRYRMVYNLLINLRKNYHLFKRNTLDLLKFIRGYFYNILKPRLKLNTPTAGAKMRIRTIIAKLKKKTVQRLKKIILEFYSVQVLKSELVKLKLQYKLLEHEKNTLLVRLQNIEKELENNSPEKGIEIIN